MKRSERLIELAKAAYDDSKYEFSDDGSEKSSLFSRSGSEYIPTDCSENNSNPSSPVYPFLEEDWDQPSSTNNISTFTTIRSVSTNDNYLEETSTFTTMLPLSTNDNSLEENSTFTTVLPLSTNDNYLEENSTFTTLLPVSTKDNFLEENANLTVKEKDNSNKDISNERQNLNGATVKNNVLAKKYGSIKSRPVNNYKYKTPCSYCSNLEVSNFERHLIRHHKDEKAVRELMTFPAKSLSRRNIISLIRYEGQFNTFLDKHGKEVHRSAEIKVPCSCCKKLISEKYLRRHHKKCIVKPVDMSGEKINHLGLSQTLIATSLQKDSVLKKIEVRKIVNRMRADEISLIVKTDPLILYYGEDYMKKQKRSQARIPCANKMRELGRLVHEIRRRTNNSDLSLLDIIDPQHFDLVIASAKTVAGFHEEKKTYRGASTAIHMATRLKDVCDLLYKLIVKEDRIIAHKLALIGREEKLKLIKRFKNLLLSQWNIEISSMAFKTMAEKKWEKPALLPLSKCILQFRDYVKQLADTSVAKLRENPEDKKAYKNLVDATLTLTILYNRRRIGDVQYMEVDCYFRSHTITQNQNEALEALTTSEKLLAEKYKRVVTGGKLTRPVTILFPEALQNYVTLLLEIRPKLVPDSNKYLFAYPGIADNWLKADVIIRKLAKQSNVENPELLTSNRLRKQIATVMQLLNLSPEENRNLCTFMNHTEKTHREFYELPQDIFQTAKISKLLILMDQGKAGEYHGKSLNEIEIDPNVDEAVEDVNEEDADLLNRISNTRKNSEKGNELRGQEIDFNDDSHEEKEEEHEEDDHEEIEEEQEEGHKPRKRKPKNIKNNTIKGRIRWNDAQKKLVLDHFKKHIAKKVPPKKEECECFKEKNSKVLYNLDWVKIKTFVYNTYKNS